MHTRWLLQDHAQLYSNTDAIAEALTDLAVPFGWAEQPEPFDDDDPPFVYGGVKFIEQADALGYLIYHTPDWSFISLALQDHLLNYGAAIVPFGCVPEAAAFFIKPIGQQKAFNGVVCTWEQYQSWRSQIGQGDVSGYYRLTMDTVVMVNRVIEIAREYRFFVVGGEVVTGSLYRDNDVRQDRPFFDSPWFSQPVADYVMMRAREWPFPVRNFVLDVAELPSGELKILEVNCINTSGLYACDANKIVTALERYWSTFSKELP